MDQLYLNFHLRSEPPTQMDGCCFGPGASYPSNGAHLVCSPYQGDLLNSPVQHVANQPWKSDPTLNSFPDATVGYWPEQGEGELDQTENSSTTSCCSVDEAGISPGSVGGYGCAYSSGQSNFAENADMAFLIKEVRPGTSMSVDIIQSETGSRNDLGRLDASEDASLGSVEEKNTSEESTSKKYKGRTIFSAEQLRVLQQRFLLQRYVTASERQDLGNAIGLTSQQVKTWFQNRRMKVKRILKEPIAGPQTGFSHTELVQNSPVVYGMPPDYMKQQFNSYSLLPRQLVPIPSQQWPAPRSVYPGLGKFHSTVIKSELQYTDQSVNLSIKKEAIALSQPELESVKIPVTSYSHGIPVQHFDFLSRPARVQQGLSYQMQKPAGDELHYEKVIIS